MSSRRGAKRQSSSLATVADADPDRTSPRRSKRIKSRQERISHKSPNEAPQVSTRRDDEDDDNEKESLSEEATVKLPVNSGKGRGRKSTRGSQNWCNLQKSVSRASQRKAQQASTDPSRKGRESLAAKRLPLGSPLAAVTETQRKGGKGKGKARAAAPMTVVEQRPACMIDALDDPILVEIFKHVAPWPAPELMRLREVCSRWNSIITNDPSIRTTIDFRGRASKYPLEYVLSRRIFQTSHLLERVYFDGYFKDARKGKHINEFLGRIHETAPLEVLSLRETPVQDIGLCNLGSRPKVKTLDLSKCEFLTDEGIREALRSCVNLESLEMTGCFGYWRSCLTPLFVLSMASENPRLRHLSMSESQGVNPRGLNPELLWMQVGQLSLTSLDLSRCPNVSRRVLRALISVCPNLEVLNLSYIPEFSQGMIAEVWALPHLKVLKLAKAGVSRPQDDFASLRSSDTNGSALRALDVSGIKRFGDSSLRHVYEVCCNLESLNMSECKDIYCIDYMANRLGSTLKSLDISYCRQLQHRIIEGAFSMLSSLESLTAVGCHMQVTEESLRNIASHGKLRFIDLSASQRIGVDGISSLLEHCPLEVLILSVIPFKTPGLIECIARYGKHLRELHIQEYPFLKADHLPELLANCTHLSMLCIYGCPDIPDSVIDECRSKYPACKILCDRDLAKRQYPVPTPIAPGPVGRPAMLRFMAVPWSAAAF